MEIHQTFVKRHLTDEELRYEIKQQDDAKVVRRLCFVGNLYAGDTIEEAARRVGASQGDSTNWLKRWNEDGSKGQIPSYWSDKLPKHSSQQSHDPQRVLADGQSGTTCKIKQIIEDEFNSHEHRSA